jgi:hypothetical protein
MVSTLDSESNDPGSNPGRTSFLRVCGGNSLLECFGANSRKHLSDYAAAPLRSLPDIHAAQSFWQSRLFQLTIPSQYSDTPTQCVIVLKICQIVYPL